jgi:hypothetical protein
MLTSQPVPSFLMLVKGVLKHGEVFYGIGKLFEDRCTYRWLEVEHGVESGIVTQPYFVKVFDALPKFTVKAVGQVAVGL